MDEVIQKLVKACGATLPTPVAGWEIIALELRENGRLTVMTSSGESFTAGCRKDFPGGVPSKCAVAEDILAALGPALPGPLVVGDLFVRTASSPMRFRLAEENNIGSVFQFLMGELGRRMDAIERRVSTQ